MKEDIIDFIEQWNARYPIDFWWRRKHKVAFNSNKHRQHSMLDMRIEFEEDRLYEEQVENKVTSMSNKERKYIPGRGMYFYGGNDSVKEKMSEEDVVDAFEKIDIKSIREDDGDIII